MEGERREPTPLVSPNDGLGEETGFPSLGGAVTAPAEMAYLHRVYVAAKRADTARDPAPLAPCRRAASAYGDRARASQ